MPVRVGLKFIDIWNESLEKAVCRYESEKVERGQIVFYGPSNFTRWSEHFGNKPLREVLLGKSGRECCVNRGFGSSCSEHQLYYYPRMVRPLEPKVLVYSGFGNAENFGYSVEETWEIAQRVIVYALTDFPECRIYLCGTNGRQNVTEERLRHTDRCDALLREFSEKTSRCIFIDPKEYEPLRRNDIYVEDGVHFNSKGYEIYTEYFKQVLKDELEEFKKKRAVALFYLFIFLCFFALLLAAQAPKKENIIMSDRSKSTMGNE